MLKGKAKWGLDPLTFVWESSHLSGSKFGEKRGNRVETFSLRLNNVSFSFLSQ